MEKLLPEPTVLKKWVGTNALYGASLCASLGTNEGIWGPGLRIMPLYVTSAIQNDPRKETEEVFLRITVEPHLRYQ